MKETTEKYIQALGRRKTATAVVRLIPLNVHKRTTPVEASIVVNNKDYKHYFPTRTLQKNIEDPLTLTNLKELYSVSARCAGGGPNAQSEAVRLALSRSIIKLDGTMKSALKKAGFLKRDPRIVERKKWGRLKARKLSQWQKR